MSIATNFQKFIGGLAGTRTTTEATPAAAVIETTHQVHEMSVSLPQKYNLQITEDNEGMNLLTLISMVTKTPIATLSGQEMVIRFEEDVLSGDDAKGYVISQPYPMSVTFSPTLSENGNN